MTKFSDLPFDFQIGNRHQATGDKPVLLLNPKNDKFLFDVDGAGGENAKKVGKFTGEVAMDDYASLPALAAECDFVLGNRKAALPDTMTIILNPKNGNLFLDFDGPEGDKAAKIGYLDLDF